MRKLLFVLNFKEIFNFPVKNVDFSDYLQQEYGYDAPYILYRESFNNAEQNREYGANRAYFLKWIKKMAVKVKESTYFYVMMEHS